MKVHLIRLNSVVPHGVGSGPESAAIDFIYTHLLQKYEQFVYSWTNINQIGEDLKEFITRDAGNKIHVNIRYPAHHDFENKTEQEKNEIRLDFVHTALLKIAEKYKGLEIRKLELIRAEILQRNFHFEIVYKTFINKKTPILTCKIIIIPKMKEFEYYAIISNGNVDICKHRIFKGIPGYFYIDRYFCYGKWKDNEVIISGKEKIVEIHISIDDCKAAIINLTPYDNPPYFTLMRADITVEEREKAYKDWHLSLDPSHLETLKRDRESWNKI